MIGLSALMLVAMSSYYLLLSAIPIQAAASDGARAAGFATAILMATTIMGELVAPRLIGLLGRRATLVLSLVIMGGSCVTAVSPSLSILLLSCAARGLGVGLLLVAACGMAAQLAPEGRRAEAMSVYGVASAIPSILCVPLGPWMLVQMGPQVTAFVAAALTVAGVIIVLGIPRTGPRHGQAQADEPQSHHMPGWRAAAWPAVALAIGAVIVGATITFLPLAHPELGAGMVMLALLLQGLSATVMRYASARYIDRHGTQSAMIAGVVLCIMSSLCLAFQGEVAVFAAMILSGSAFGILQGATLAELLARATPSTLDGAGALWNAAYDAGLGIGGLLLGLLAASAGYNSAFLITAAGLLIVALVVVFRIELRRGAR
jgi:predicted MFS family arabinose efflux permease